MKQITRLQAEALCIGATVSRYPYNGAPEAEFDPKRTRYIETYEVRSVNTANNMLELVMSGASASFYPTPVQVGRIFIKMEALVTQQLWWVSDENL